MIAGVILAGGRASRMGGGDKPLRLLGDKPLIGHAIDRLRLQVGALAINANGDPARYAGFGLPVIADTVPGQPGPLAGILAGMHWAAALGASHLATAAGDTPFFPRDLVARLLAARGDAAVVLAASDDPDRGVAPHPTFGLWPVDLAPALDHALRIEDQRKVRAVAARHGDALALFQGALPFFNVNTPDDLARAITLAGGAP